MINDLPTLECDFKQTDQLITIPNIQQSPFFSLR